MIPYDDLERALARWKTRRAGGQDAPEAAAPETSEPEGDKTPSGLVVIASLDASARYEAKDATGELDLTDAELDET